MKKRSFLAGFAAAVLAMLLLALVLVLFTAYTGSYNIAASEDHSPFVRWAFETTMHNSVERQAADIKAPEFSAQMIASGASEYKAMCQQCHGGPGVAADSFSRGMLPQPPHLHEAADEWKAREVFWLVRHGVKMTGMPAFGKSHDDETVWAITAFVMQLPGMTEEEYRRFESGHEHH